MADEKKIQIKKVKGTASKVVKFKLSLSEVTYDNGEFKMNCKTFSIEIETPENLVNEFHEQLMNLFNQLQQN
jgi:lipopolysaccharide biosynthesis regulator YciM